jgi:hypothetical protein
MIITKQLSPTSMLVLLMLATAAFERNGEAFQHALLLANGIAARREIIAIRSRSVFKSRVVTGLRPPEIEANIKIGVERAVSANSQRVPEFVCCHALIGRFGIGARIEREVIELNFGLLNRLLAWKK